MQLKSLTLSAALVAAAATSVRAITIDGSRDAGYGTPLATQTINTGFGDSTVGDGTSGGGSELDAAYGVVSGGNLNLFVSGNSENGGNHIILFIADGRAGQSTLALPTTNTTGVMNGSKFSPGFAVTQVLDINNFQGTAYVEEYSTVGGTGTGTYQGNFALSGGIGTGSPDSGNANNPFTGGSVTYGFNETNAAGVNGNTGTAADPSAANAVSTGLEVSIPLAILGNTTGNIQVLAVINGGGDSYLSNQFLPGLAVGSGNLGTSTFDLSAVNGGFFTVTQAPEPASLGLLGLTAVAGLRRRRA